MLIAFEGIDGAGKSTQVKMLRDWLAQQHLPCVVSEWNSGNLVHRALRDAKRDRLLTARTYSLFHALDFTERYEREIMPGLATGESSTVICDRYIYTAYARDAVRGIHSRWLQSVYNFARRPDVTFYLRVQPELALARILRGRKVKGHKAAVKYYEAGLDTKLSPSPERCFLLFQRRVQMEYERLAGLLDFTIIDEDVTPTAEGQAAQIQAVLIPAYAKYSTAEKELASKQ